MITQKELEHLMQRARALGALEAKVISPGVNVFTASWVRLKCQFGCGGFNSNLCCPPFTPTPGQTSAILSEYSRGLLLHFGPEGHVRKTVVALEREIFLAGYHKAFGFAAGPCSLCKECTFKGCVLPDDARPSMEACGIDVFATARYNGFPIEVVKDEGCTQNYYGLVLIE